MGTIIQRHLLANPRRSMFAYCARMDLGNLRTGSVIRLLTIEHERNQRPPAHRGSGVDCGWAEGLASGMGLRLLGRSLRFLHDGC